MNLNSKNFIKDLLNKPKRFSIKVLIMKMKIIQILPKIHLKEIKNLWSHIKKKTMIKS